MRLVAFGCWEEYKGGPIYLLRRLTPDEVDLMLTLAKTARSAQVIDVTLWAADLDRLYMIENDLAPPATGTHDPDGGVFAPGRPSLRDESNLRPINRVAQRVTKIGRRRKKPADAREGGGG